MKKIIRSVPFVVCFVYVMWVLISTVEIATNNLNKNPEYHSWNFFTMMSKQEEEETQETAETQSFDTTFLDEWCGEPAGRIRMIGGWYHAENEIEDEAGNVWEWFGDLEENGFYLLWIDDSGTERVEDDTIIKVWQENH